MKEKAKKHPLAIRRKKLGLSRNDLCEKIDGKVSLETIGRIERGDRIPRSDTIGILAEALDCEPDYLLGRIPYPRRDVSEISEQIPLKEDAILALLRLNESVKSNTPFTNVHADIGFFEGEADFIAGLIDWFIRGIAWNIDNSSVLETVSKLFQQLSWSNQTEHNWDLAAHEMNTMIEQNARYEVGRIFGLFVQEYIQDYLKKNSDKEA